MPLLRIGTSGYSYPHWIGKFYPEDVPSKEWLSFYATHFNTVELNVTFYRLPLAKTFANWYKITPPKFCFALKGSRFITHVRRLKDVGESLNNFFERAEKLQEKLGIILWQLPPSLQANPELFAEFSNLLRHEPTAAKMRHAFEFRHNSWFSPDIYELLQEHGFALCIADAPYWPCVEEITADYVYLRFHGSRRLYSSCYTTEELQTWAEKIRRWLDQGRDVYAYFNNDAGGYAIDNARELLTLVQKPSIQP